MEPRFKVGDTVHIKQLLKLPYRPPYGINEKMYLFSGKEAKITKVKPNAYSGESYKDIPDYISLDEAKYTIDIDMGEWSWSLPMLSSTKESPAIRAKLTEDSIVNVRVTKKKSIKFNFSN